MSVIMEREARSVNQLKWINAQIASLVLLSTKYSSQENLKCHFGKPKVIYEVYDASIIQFYVGSVENNRHRIPAK